MNKTNLDIRIIGHEMTVRLTWPLPLEFEDEIARLATTHSLHKIFLDFSELYDINSMGISALASLALTPALKQVKIELIHINKRIKRIIKMVGIDKLFVLTESNDTNQTRSEIDIHSARQALDTLAHTQDETARKTLEAFIDQAAQTAIQLGENKRIIESWKNDTEEKIKAKTDELTKMQQQLIHSERLISIGQLSAGVAHEFNNIIAGMRGYAQLAQMRNDEESIKQALSVVIDLSDRASTITEGLLSFSRKKNPIKCLCNLQLIGKKVLTLIEKQCLVQGITVVTHWGELENIEFDPSQIEQVLLNILTNAVHALRKGGTITVTTAQEEDFHYISIKDTGPGIPEKIITKIFDPFFTTKGALGGGETQGTGLGLSISQGIIFSHKGHIEVTSNEKGTEFRVYLPCITKQSSSLTDMPKKEGPASASNTSYDILVVDDEPHLCHIMSSYFKHKGHTVRIAQNGGAAIAYCKERKPDIVFLDILMPGLNGPDTFVEMKRCHKDFATVIVTGHAGKELQHILDTMRHIGSIELVRKPFNFTTLQNAMDRALKNSSS